MISAAIKRKLNGWFTDVTTERQRKNGSLWLTDRKTRYVYQIRKSGWLSCFNADQMRRHKEYFKHHVPTCKDCKAQWKGRAIPQYPWGTAYLICRYRCFSVEAVERVLSHASRIRSYLK